MRIVIDLQSCQSGSKIGGIGRYSAELAKAMIRIAPDIDFIVAINNNLPASINYIHSQFRNIIPDDNIRSFFVPKNVAYSNGDLLRTKTAELIREQFIADLNPDFVHISSLVEGFSEDVVTSIHALDGSPPTAVTLYDLIPFKQPETYLSEKNIRQHYYRRLDQLKQADLFLAISQYSADEASELLGIQPERLAVIHGGIDERFRILPEHHRSRSPVLDKLGIAKRFVLYTASFDQRKNQERLVRAFARLPLSVRGDLKLVIVGNGWPEVYAHLHQVAESEGLDPKDVIFTGIVSDDDLVALYNTCTLFAFVSLWEGLGLPVVEAMACGAPVIASNTTSIPEVHGFPVATFDPTDTDAISETMKRALTDDTLITELKNHAREQIGQYTWENCARIALTAIYRRRKEISRGDSYSRKHGNLMDALRKLSLPRPGAREAWYSAAVNELQTDASWCQGTNLSICWITSWGTRCGIAAYSKNLIESFSAHVHVLAPYASNVVDGDRHVTRCWEQGQTDDLRTLAAAIDKCNCADIVIQFNFGFFSIAALSELIEHLLRQNKNVYITLHATVDPPVSYNLGKLSDLNTALLQSAAVLVHSEADIERLANVGVDKNVVLIPQIIRVFAENNQSPAENVGGNKGELIASYGFFLPKKGLPELVEAVDIARRSGRDIKLLLVNADYGDSGGVSANLINETTNLVNHLGLSEHVTFVTDFLPDEKSIEYLRTANLIVYPYQMTGESSSAAVRMGLASGKPIAVTPLEIFNDVKDVSFMLPGVSSSELAKGILAALDDIKENSASNQSREAAATRWRNANAGGARYIERLIRLKSTTFNIWTNIFTADVLKLPTINAIKSDNFLQSKPQGGLMVYGPYITLQAGVYRLVVEGITGPGDVGLLEVTKNDGQSVIQSFAIPGEISGIILTVEIEVKEQVKNVEVRIFTAANADIKLFGYSIEHR